MTGLQVPGILLITGLVIISGQSLRAQSPPTVQNGKTSDEIRRENIQKQQEAEWVKKMKTGGLPDNPNIPDVKPAPPARPTAIRPDKKQRLRLRPEAEDLARYADFLKQSNTGLIRLFPELDCGGRFVVHAGGPCADEIPFSSFYSFRKKNYSERGLSDIGLKDGFFFNDGWLSNAMIVSLGDKALESVSPDTDGLKFLFDYQPSTKKDEILAKSAEMIKGLQAGNHFYAKAIRAEEKTTYAARVIAYRGKVLRAGENNLLKNELEGDKRIDIIVAFRVVREDRDGVLTLLWKELQRKDSPKTNNSDK